MTNDSQFERAISLVECALKEMAKAAQDERGTPDAHCGRLLDFADGLHVFSRRLERICSLAPELRPPQESGK